MIHEPNVVTVSRQAPVALITGASRGIGRGIALELAKSGYNLVLNFLSNELAAWEAKALALAALVRPASQVEIFPADISLPHDREQLLSFVRRQFGRLDLLVNNAGVAPQLHADLLETSEESFDRLTEINLKGPFFLTQAAARWMLESISQGGLADYRPKIIIIGSICAYTASVDRGDYCITKAGLSMITKLFAARLADADIPVFEIRPGIIASDMNAGVKEKYDHLIAEGLSPIRRWGTPEDVGRAVAAIADEHFPFSTGEVINVDGGFHLHRL